MLVTDDVLKPVTLLVMIPVVLAEELLQRSGRHAGIDRDRLDALLGDIGELPRDIDRQVGAGVPTWKTIIEPFEKLSELGLQLPDLLRVHAGPSINLGREHRFDMAGVSSHHDSDPSPPGVLKLNHGGALRYGCDNRCA